MKPPLLGLLGLLGPSRVVAGLLMAFTAGAGACSTEVKNAHGVCTPSVDPALGCAGTPAPDGGVAPGLGLTGYACTGSARPDDDPTYDQGVPQGIVCADRGALADGTQGYCCSQTVTPCALNPIGVCDSGSFSYQCRGSQRPEAFDALLHCGQGVLEGDWIDYCCSGEPLVDGCLQSDSVSCSARMLGFTCQGRNQPKAEQLGANKSRADVYRLLCATPTPASNPAYNNYCCYTPGLVPVSGTCVPDVGVPGCAPGRFGFSCYGPDTPDQDYPPMHCPDPGVTGRNAEGYLASLYCCDFT